MIMPTCIRIHLKNFISYQNDVTKFESYLINKDIAKIWIYTITIKMALVLNKLAALPNRHYYRSIKKNNVSFSKRKI